MQQKAGKGRQRRYDMDMNQGEPMTINQRDHAIRLLVSGFASEFADFCAGDERVHELMMDLAYEFVEFEIPIVSEDDKIDVAAEMIMSVTMKVV